MSAFLTIFAGMNGSHTNRKIILLGYMGSGKSVIAKGLKDLIKVPYTDLDDYIEEIEGVSIADIFKTKGEIYFRKIEAKYLKLLLNTPGEMIISVGGGTPCYGMNLKHILEDGLSFYLKASVGTLFDRLRNETSKRPIVAEIGEEHLIEFIAKHLFERRFYYDQANFTIETDSKDISTIADELSGLL